MNYPINQQIDYAQIAKNLSVHLNEDIPASQVVRAVKRYDMSFLPYFRTVNYTFSAVSATSGLQSINIDASFGFFVTGIGGMTNSTDANPFITAVQLNNGYNLLPEPLPWIHLTRYVCKPLDYSMFVPPISQLQTNIQNGSTTASAYFYVTYFGYKLPTKDIERITGKSLG